MGVTITDGVSTIELLSELEFSIIPIRLGSETVTAGGKTVLDVIGTKNRLVIPTGWLSPVELNKLVTMIKQNPALTVTYPSLSGEVTDVFVFELPELKTFKYDESGVAQWYGVTLEATQQEVD